MALDSYVGKQEARAINEALDKLLGKQQNRLIKNGVASAPEALTASENINEKETEGRGARRSKNSRVLDRNRDAEDLDYEDENDEGMGESPAANSRSIRKASQKSTASRKRATSSRVSSSKNYSDSDEQYAEEQPKAKPNVKPRATSSRTTGRGRGRKTAINYEESEDADEDLQAVDLPPSNRRTANLSRSRASKKRVDYSVEESDEDNEYEDVKVEDDPSPPKKRRGRTPATSSKKASSSSRRSSGSLSQSQLSFEPIKRKTAREPATKNKRNVRSRAARYNDSDSGDSFTLKNRSYDNDGDDSGSAY